MASSSPPSPSDPDRVLIITYLFPPTGGVGVPRFVSYSQYLPREGCEVFVLTASNPATPAYDPDLARQVPPETRVFRAFNPEVPYGLRDRLWKRILSGGGAAQGTPAPKPLAGWKRLAKEMVQRIFCPDVQVVWRPFAIRKARQIIRRYGITTVLVNLPPYSCLYIAAAVKRAFPHVKLILDFRDEWIDNYLLTFDTAATGYKLALARRVEAEAVRRADFVAAVTRSQLQQIRSRYPDLPDSRFVYAPNGYDPVLYSRVPDRPKASGKMIVMYFGTVYANPTYDPIFNFLDGLDALQAEIRERIEVHFIGRVAREAEHFLNGRKCAIRQFGFMPKQSALEYLAAADYNLIVSRSPTTHGGKLFDYLALGKPILALSPAEGELAQLIRETRTGQCVGPDDQEAIQQMILDAYRQVTSGCQPPQPDWEAIRNYAWPNLVERFAHNTGLGTARGAAKPRA